MKHGYLKVPLLLIAFSVSLVFPASAAPSVRWMDDNWFPYGIPRSFEDGPVALWYPNKTANFYTVDGEPLLEGPSDGVSTAFRNGLAAIFKNDQVCFIDTTGEVVIPFREYEAVSPFSPDGLCYIPGGDRYFYIDMSGQEVLDVTDTDFNSSAFYEGLALAWTTVNGVQKYGYMDLTGEVVIPFQFDDAFSFNHGNAEVRVMKDGEETYGIIDREGNFVIPCGAYDRVKIMNDGTIIANNQSPKKGLYCFDPSGALLFSLDGYTTYADSFNDGLAEVVSEDGLSGYIDRNGTVVIPAQYDYASDFHEGLALVEKDEALMVIDTTGAVISSVELPTNGDFPKEEISLGFGLGFSEGLANLYVYYGSTYREGYIDRNGEWVIPPIYDEASPFFEEGVTWVRQGERVGILKNPLDVVSPWANEGVQQADKLGLITANTGRCYPFPITRQKFAELSVNLVEQVTGHELEAGGFPFTDTADRAVRKAAAAGLVNGVGDGSKFDPSAQITREQLAVMLARTIHVIEEASGKTVLTSGDLTAYTDADQVSTWAAPSVSALSASGIMQGTSANTLGPQDTTTVEQAVLLTLRAYQAFQ